SERLVRAVRTGVVVEGRTRFPGAVRCTIRRVWDKGGTARDGRFGERGPAGQPGTRAAHGTCTRAVFTSSGGLRDGPEQDGGVQSARAPAGPRPGHGGG